jgi:sulfite exporter TauE/SafE
MNLIAIFFTGLLAGGLSCMAVQGGLLTATLAQREEQKLKEGLKSTGNALPIIAFLIAKLIAYTVFGLLLGLLGSFFELSLTVKTIMQFAIVFFMLGVALNMLNVHPIFRYFIIQPPKFLTRLTRKKAKSNDVFAPAMLGAFTIFIPCGVTQSMMALAIASGSPLKGALIMFAFILGTSPVFFVLGYFVTKIGDMLQEKFMKIAAIVIILLALFNLNNAIALTGSNFTAENIVKGAWCTISFCDSTAQAQGSNAASATASDQTIEITSIGYNPESITVKAGASITLHLTNTNGGGCIQSFTIPSLGLQKVVPVGTSDVITFTAPSTPGQIPFMCGMGMYRGVINVI